LLIKPAILDNQQGLDQATSDGALRQATGASLPATTHSFYLSAMLVAEICRFGIGVL